MQKTILAAALIAAAEAAKKACIAHAVVTIKARPELPAVCMIDPVKPPRFNAGDTWRRSGKRKGKRAS